MVVKSETCAILLACLLLSNLTQPSHATNSYVIIQSDNSSNQSTFTGSEEVIEAIYPNDTSDLDGARNQTGLPLFTLVVQDKADGTESSSFPEFDAFPARNESLGVLEYRESFPVRSFDFGARRKVLYVLGLFELTGPCDAARGGPSEKAAANLAIRHVNERDVVPGYRLEMYDNDTKVLYVSECHVR
ncbi:hypothetical protein ISCGN_027286 [Ixodes scapularis]|uniref:Uncharacterized protein n=1 Tax=Ixodes scapularis TaxID=6945 RepID=B7QL29_IXOSC|nr:hypothetical protein IscW_ISCW023616 [Ixodes scapularis]|eukprot:XP_002415884.1 hypothetical protein IscW_ISCW023616 [Ixodes scapularis]